jgi:hypothetical protein
VDCYYSNNIRPSNRSFLFKVDVVMYHNNDIIYNNIELVEIERIDT